MAVNQLRQRLGQSFAKAYQYRLAIYFGVAILLCWEIYATYFNPRGNQYFPSLRYIVTQTVTSSDVLLTGIQSTGIAVVTAYLLSLIVGIVLGMLFAEVYTVRQLFTPSLLFVYAIPSAIIAPLFILWLGTGLQGISIFGGYVAFFPVFINTFTGMNQVEEEYHDLGAMYGATRWQMIRFIKFWKAVPHIAASAKIAVQYCVVGVVVVEFLAGGSGLGYMIVLQTQRAQLGFVYGILFTLIVFAIVFFMSVSKTVDYLTPST
jgi:NitT/TauT family transport system permease protein